MAALNWILLEIIRESFCVHTNITSTKSPSVDQSLSMLIEAAFKCVNGLSAWPLEASDFESIKREIKKKIRSMESSRLSDDLLAGILISNAVSNVQIYGELDKITLKDMQEFAETFKKRLQIRIQFAGNLAEKEMSDRLLRMLVGKDGPQIRQLPIGRSHVKFWAASRRHLKQFYQIGEGSVESRFLLGIFVGLLGQVMPGVHVKIETFGNIVGFSLTKFAWDNADAVTPETIDNCVLLKIEEVIQKKSKDELQKLADQVIDRDLRDPPELMVNRSSLKSQVLAFYRTWIKTKESRSLTIEVIEKGGAMRDLKLKIVTEKAAGDGMSIFDLGEFKDLLGLYPVSV
jgi:hypothetical protein